MKTIRPLKLGTPFLHDSESRLICRTILLDMLGETTITAENGDLAGVTGLVWKHEDLALATLHLPRTPLRLKAHGLGTLDVVIVRAIDGPLIVHQRKNRFKLAPRDVIFLPADMPSEMILPEGGRLNCAHFPNTAIPPAAKFLHQVLLCPFPADYLPLQLLTTYAGYLLQHDHQNMEHASMMVAHFYSLIPVLAQYTEGTPQAEAPRGRLHTIKAMIEKNLADGSFSVADVARAEGISIRAVQKLFNRTGTTFSRYVLERRLILAKDRILAEHATTPIGQIVYSVGFNDLSYFSRIFRGRYGVRPTDMRRMTRQMQDEV